MHRELLSTFLDKETDHINGCGLDNRRQNLRRCLKIENNRNRKPHLNSTSRFKGVRFSQGKWESQICSNYKTIYLGQFDSEIDAAKVYDQKAKELFGEFAYVNFPQTD